MDHDDVLWTFGDGPYQHQSLGQLRSFTIYIQNKKVAVSLAICLALHHIDNKNAYIRMLFTDYSSVLNSIIQNKLKHELLDLGLGASISNWFQVFLTGLELVITFVPT